MLANPICCQPGQGQRMRFGLLKRHSFMTLLGGMTVARPLAAVALQWFPQATIFGFLVNPSYPPSEGQCRRCITSENLPRPAAW